MKLNTLSAVLELLADGRAVKRSDVAARVLRRRIYVTGSGQPGCLYDSGPDYHATKKAAVDSLVWLADDGEGTPRGMRAALLREGRYIDANGVRYEVSQDALGSVLS